jgi:hypothetical protein
LAQATISTNELTDYQSGGWFLRLRETSDVVEAAFRRVCKHAGYIGDHGSDVIVSGAQMHGVHMQFQHAIAQASVGFNVAPLPPCATGKYAVSTHLNVLR